MDKKSLKYLREWVANSKGEVRCIKTEHPLGMCIFDNRSVIMAINPNLGVYKTAGLFTNNSSFVTISQNHFEYLWLISKKIPKD